VFPATPFVPRLGAVVPLADPRLRDGDDPRVLTLEEWGAVPSPIGLSAHGCDDDTPG